MGDWLFAALMLIVMGMGTSGCVLGARAAWVKSNHGDSEPWFAVMAVLLIWGGCWFYGAIDTAGWLLSHVWLLG